MNSPPTYVLERTFDAPRELVWRGWTDPALLARWYGPNVETIIHRLDLTPGGLWLLEMRRGGHSSFQPNFVALKGCQRQLRRRSPIFIFSRAEYLDVAIELRHMATDVSMTPHPLDMPWC